MVVPRNNFETFLEQYENLASDAVGYGPAEDRQSILGSPVVPRTAQKIAEDNDGYQLYRIIILKSFKDVYAQALQKARFTVRDIPSKPIKNKREEFDIEIQPANSKEEETEDESAEIKFADAENQFEQSRNQLRRWAKTHYGEAFIAWIHVKAIRTFVEAVLLYGLPVDFVAALVKPKKKTHEQKIRERLLKLYSLSVGSDSTEVSEAVASSDPNNAYYPYVSFTFKPLTSD